MKLFELASKENKDGKRRFRLVLYRIFPDECVDTVNEVGTEYNKNGITWIREYCEQALDSVRGMFLRCEFADEERTELLGHGFTGVDSGEPTFEDACTIGVFTDATIEDIETDEGTITACIGSGEIDAQCYHNFVQKLESDIAKGIYPNGSVEIMHTSENDEIIYKYGYKEKGRIPMIFRHSGYCLLGVTPADDNAVLLELNENQKEESNQMNELEIKALVSQTVSELSDRTSEINQIKEDCEAKVAEANEAMEKAIAEKNEIEANSAAIQEALDALKVEVEELHKQLDAAWEERNALEKALGEAKARERLSEMNTAIAGFTDEEKAYAQAEIEAFNADPLNVEINSITDKIWLEIGKASKAKAEADEKAISEQNSVNDIEDIFCEVGISGESLEDINIF